MLIQRRRLAFDRAKHRRAEILAQRARGEEESHHTNSTEGTPMRMMLNWIWMPSVPSPCDWYARS
jgi:small-conductance mechanosensitive channel